MEYVDDKHIMLFKRWLSKILTSANINIAPDLAKWTQCLMLFVVDFFNSNHDENLEQPIHNLYLHHVWEIW